MSKISINELAEAIRNAPTNSDISLAEALDKIESIKRQSTAEQTLKNRRVLAYAQHKKVAVLDGYIKAISSVHPLQTELEVLITTFQPNKNKQGIKKSEASNILRTAKNSPLKINYDTLSHKNAVAVGTITDVSEATDRIIGRAVIWNNESEEVAEYIQSTAIATSWEVFYDPDKSVIEHGIEWLYGCVFAGLCIVDNPAYGSDARAKVIT